MCILLPTALRTLYRHNKLPVHIASQQENIVKTVARHMRQILDFPVDPSVYRASGDPLARKVADILAKTLVVFVQPVVQILFRQILPAPRHVDHCLFVP